MRERKYERVALLVDVRVREGDREIENVGVNHGMNWLGHFYSEGIHFP